MTSETQMSCMPQFPHFRIPRHLTIQLMPHGWDILVSESITKMEKLRLVRMNNRPSGE